MFKLYFLLSWKNEKKKFSNPSEHFVWDCCNISVHSLQIVKNLVHSLNKTKTFINAHPPNQPGTYNYYILIANNRLMEKSSAFPIGEHLSIDHKKIYYLFLSQLLTGFYRTTFHLKLLILLRLSIGELILGKPSRSHGGKPLLPLDIPGVEMDCR